MEDESPFIPVVQRFFEKDPTAAAHTLETMDEDEVVAILRILPPKVAAQTIRQLQVRYAAALLKESSADLVKEIVRELDPQQTAAIFMHLPEAARLEFIKHVPKKLQREIREQLSFPEGSVGRVMTTQFLAFSQDLTVKATIAKIRQLAAKRFPSSYTYVIDDKKRLVGVINMRDMMLAEPEQPLATIMRREIFTLNSFMDREEAANELSKRRYFAAPVVDAEGHILGIIKAEQLLNDMQEEAAEDILLMVGAGGDEKSFSPLFYSLRQRLPWLHVNLLTAFMAAGVIALFEDMIAQMTVLAVYLPIVAGQGGNAGAQSLAIVMRGLVMREIPPERVRWLITKEGLLGLTNGLITGAVTAVIATLWQGNPWLGVVVCLAMVVNLLMAGLAGASIPLVMKAVGLDPAQCSSIILTTVTDVVGFFAFLGFAMIFKGYLIT